MPILSAQILLGFQLCGAFSDGYDQLFSNARYLDGLALRLMVSVAGLLFLPGPYHSCRHGGAKTTRISTAWSRPLPILPFFPSRSPSALMPSSPPGAFWGYDRRRHWKRNHRGSHPLLVRSSVAAETGCRTARACDDQRKDQKIRGHARER